MKKKILLFLLVITIIISSFSGCSKKEPPEKEIPPYPALTTENITLTLAELTISQERTDILRQIADKYEADYKNVKIEIKSYKTEEEIAQALKSGQVDLAELSDEKLMEYAGEGLLSDLTDAMEYWDEEYTMLSAARDAAYKYDYTPYFIPHTLYQQALVYRRDFLDGALAALDKKVTDMTTWEAWLQFVDYCCEQHTFKYGILYDTTAPIYELADLLIWDYVGSANIADKYNAYFNTDDDNATIFTTEEARAGLRVFKEIAERIGQPFDSAAEPTNIAEEFVSGKAPAIIAQPADIYEIEHSMDKGLWTAVPLPGGTETAQGYYSSTCKGFAVSANAVDDDTAKSFLLFLSNSDNNTYFVKNTGGIPLHTDAKDKDKFFTTTGLLVYTTIAQKPGSYLTVSAPENYKAFNEYKKDVDSEYQKFLSGEMTDEKLLDYLDAYWKNAYDTEGQMWYTKEEIKEMNKKK